MDNSVSAADERILAILAADSKMAVAKVAEKAGLPPSTVRRRIRRLGESGIIKRYTIERGDGMATRAIVLISAESASDISKISASLARLAAGGPAGSRAGGARGGPARAGRRGRAGAGGLACISSIYEITGQHDIAVVMSAAGITQINEAIDTVRRVPGVTDTNTVIILKTVL